MATTFILFNLFTRILRGKNRTGNRCPVLTLACLTIKKKGQPSALKLPHSQGPGRGPTIWCIVRR